MKDRPRFLDEVEAHMAVMGKVATIFGIIDSHLNRPNGASGYRRVHDRHWEPEMGDEHVGFDFFEREGIKAMCMESQGVSKAVIIKDGRPTVSTRSADKIKELLKSRKNRSLILDFSGGTTVESLDDFIKTYRYAEYQSLAHQD